MKKDQKQLHDAGRRNFLRGSARVGTVAAVVAAVPGTASAADEAQLDTEKKGYRLTNHIVAYYKTTTS
jgi:hypothetical protein